jgi:hypothetical protein
VKKPGVLVLLGLATALAAAFLSLWLGVFLRAHSVATDILVLMALAVNLLAAVRFARDRRDTGAARADADGLRGPGALFGEQRMLYTSWIVLLLAAVLWGIGLFVSREPASSLEAVIASLKRTQERMLDDMEREYQECETEEQRERFLADLARGGREAVPLVLDLFEHTEDQVLRRRLVAVLEKITGLTLSRRITERPGAHGHELREKVEAITVQVLEGR